MTKSNLSLLSFSFLILIGCNQPETIRTTPQGRAEYELARLKDPATGEIPEGIRMKELAFSSTLPRMSFKTDSISRAYKTIGPYNVGGRTRAVLFDQFNPSILLAGAVSGGMWRSVNSGDSWTRTTAPEDHAAVSCIVQDTRPGMEGNWYYGSGEFTGNSASKSFSATYTGSGVYHSSDNGLTWQLLNATETSPEAITEWSYVHRLVIDPTRTDSTVILAATHRGINYSNDGGASWTRVLGNGSSWTDIVVSSTGVFYASIESSATANSGFWRSTDGLNWTPITPSGLSTHERTVIALAPSNEDVVYFLTETPGTGNPNSPTSPSEYHSMWRYTYVNGNGSGAGGSWSDRSSGLPSDNFFRNLSVFGGYCMGIAVKPDNENTVFIGGTNMFRSTNGFLDQSQTSQIGGYWAEGYTNFDWLTDNHHPDMQWITFHPNNPDKLLCSTDGGIHFTLDCTASKVDWNSFNNGFVSSQFYAVSVDKWDTNNTVVTGGLQDNGTWHTSQLDATEDWSNIRGADGAYTAVAGNGQIHYTSTQYANIERMRIDLNGNVLASYDAMPNGTSGYLFVHPFTLDPADENTMYLPNFNRLYVNTNLAALETGSKQWQVKATFPVSDDITALAASKTPRGVVYAGSSNKRLFKVTNAHQGGTTFEDISSNIERGGYTSCIAVDERNADKVAVIYSNYRTRSAWYSEDGGQTFVSIEGNLKGQAAPGTPPQFDYLTDGPSFRWLEIIPINDTSTVYLLGTSIGLFSTDILQGDSTVWIQESGDLIGNVVVDMIEFRQEDGFTAIGTHGNGVFTTFFNRVEVEQPTDTTDTTINSITESLIERHNVRVFPNPASDRVNVSLELFHQDILKAKVVDLNGRSVLATRRMNLQAGDHILEWNVSDLPSGNYFIQLTGTDLQITRPLLVR